MNSKIMCLRNHALFLIVFTLMAAIPRVMGYSHQPTKPRLDGMQERSDKQLLVDLESANPKTASQAAQEIFIRGERMIPLLLSLRSKDKNFVGSGLGNSQAAQITFIPLSKKKIDKGYLVTIEVASLYLISAIYHGNLSFAESPYLTDLSIPPIDRKAFNSKVLINKAWLSVEAWAKELQREGLESMRSKKNTPLKNSGVAFW